jgi:hypothetical protein
MVPTGMHSYLYPFQRHFLALQNGFRRDEFRFAILVLNSAIDL